MVKFTRRKILLASSITVGSLSGCIGSAQNNPSQQGDTDCVPPGQYECPDGELIAVHEFDGCSVSQTEGDCDIAVEVTESEDENGSCDAFGFSWAVKDEDCTVSHIRVYGGSDCEDIDPDSETDGNVSTNLQAGQGEQQAGISNIRFCGNVEEPDDPDDPDEPNRKEKKKKKAKKGSEDDDY